MSRRKHQLDQCPIHGVNRKRDTCRACNAIYMRDYLRRQRLRDPAVGLIDRARDRARQQGLRFSLRRVDIAIPKVCPVLGTAIVAGPSRASGSPSLDRVRPDLGYVPENVRVISDRANRMKSDRDLTALKRLAEDGPAASRDEYTLIVRYLERETLLAEVRRKAGLGGRHGAEWAKIASFLDRRFQHGPGI